MEESPFSQIIPDKPQTPKWIIVVEKIIAVVYLLIAFAMGVVVISSLDMIFERDYYGGSTFDRLMEFLSSFGFTIVQVVLFGFSGVLLLLRKKWGWLLATLAASLFAFWAIFNLIYVYSLTFQMPSLFNTWAFILFLVFGYIIFFLNRKAVRLRYDVTKNDYRNLLYYFLSISALKVFEYVL